MAEPDQRPDEQDDTVDRSSDDTGAVSESGSLDDDGSSEYGDAISDEATTGDEHSDLDDADPRTSGYAGGQAEQKAAAAEEVKAEEDAADPESGGADATAAEVAAASTTTGTRAEKAANKKKLKEGKASRSGNPAKAAKGDAPVKSKVSRTPVKPKVVGNRWAAPAMLTSAGIGLAWIVVFYVTQDRVDIPWYSDLGSWNLVIGMGFIVAAFGFSMKWE